ncbi:VOC family protein [Sporosarcina obsidiansis]|uniref:VOC family protein n=1 Tax=Sporosarcina obsidiansis TaxID=2660748 RepID=UPI00129B763D|nr:VOC family protein [Sporosarcina obsidiansis]
MEFHSAPKTFVGHVNIIVEDLERSLMFYQEILGFDVMERSATTAKLTADGTTSFLSLQQPEHVIRKQGRTTGLYHFAILLPKRSDLADVVIRLMKKGIPFGSADHLVSEAVYLNDPDGNGIEIYIDRAPSEWIWQGEEVQMTVDPLDIENLVERGGLESSWKGMAKGAVMGHIHLHVAELEKTEEFYVKGLGFDVVNRYGGQALFLSTGKYHHHIAVNTWNGPGAPTPPPHSVGLHSFTLVYPNEEVRSQVVADLQRLGASVRKEEPHFITCDPSGHCVILAIG